MEVKKLSTIEGYGTSINHMFKPKGIWILVMIWNLIFCLPISRDQEASHPVHTTGGVGIRLEGDDGGPF